MKYEKVVDRRGLNIKGLWKRGNVYYAQLVVCRNGLKYPNKIAMPQSITSVPQAIEELVLMRKKNNDGELIGKKGDCPAFGKYMEYYLKTASKSPKTMLNEKSFLQQWESFIGSQTPINKITEIDINGFITK